MYTPQQRDLWRDRQGAAEQQARIVYRQANELMELRQANRELLALVVDLEAEVAALKMAQGVAQ